MKTGVAVARREARIRRHARVRRRVSGTVERPRLAVFRSLRHIYAQVIDDEAGHTLVATSTLDPALTADLAGTRRRSEQAAVVGRAVAERARAAGITTVVFDRGGYRYHGRLRALAEAAREAGLSF
jgi:large subunit ribosomal protein L18